MDFVKTLETFCYKPQSFPANTTIIKQGKYASDVYVLLSGTVSVMTGGVEIGAFNLKGEVFGEMASLLNKPASATVETTEESTFYVIRNFEEFLAKNPALCMSLLKLTMERLSKMNKGVNIMLNMIS